jgi:hypothetical protein
MEGKIPGGHPEEIKNYQCSPDRPQIEKWRTTFHHNIACYIERTAMENNMKVFVVDQRTDKASVEQMIIEQFQL